MNQPPKQNIFDRCEFPPNFMPQYSNSHLMTHTLRDFTITFELAQSPSLKTKVIAQIILTKEHLLELSINIKKQLELFDQDGNPPPKSRI